MDASKHVLLVSERKSSIKKAMKEIGNHGWTIQYAASLQECEQAIGAHDYDVGIIYLEEKNITNRKDVENIIDGHGIEWIALIEEKLLKKNDACRLILEMFYAYHVTPIDSSRISCLLEHARNMAGLRRKADNAACEGYGDNENKMVGGTPTMKTLYDTIRKVAMVDAPVFISGESGTGKELTARAIHDRSIRADGPFNAVNCGALPSNLIQSELFGHEKGAFTGATQRKIGRIEATQGGTLFLDEIGDLPLDMQVNLLRFLENHKVQRVGGLSEIPVDVRVLAATHVDLEKAVEEGIFREDLYHRLNVLQVNVPPLRERQEDIEQLANFFFKKFSCEKPIQVRGFSQDSIALMLQYDWPGNIRELINRVRRAMVMCENRLISPSDLGLERRCRSSRHIITLEQARDMAECEVIRSALVRNKFKIQHAAKDLGVSRVTLYRLMEKHHILRNGDEIGQKPEDEGARSAVVQLSSV